MVNKTNCEHLMLYICYKANSMSSTLPSAATHYNSFTFNILENYYSLREVLIPRPTLKLKELFGFNVQKFC